MARKISLAEAAEIYGISVRTLHRYIAEGRISAYRIGPRMIRVDVEKLAQQLVVERINGSP